MFDKKKTVDGGPQFLKSFTRKKIDFWILPADEPVTKLVFAHGTPHMSKDTVERNHMNVISVIVLES